MEAVPSHYQSLILILILTKTLDKTWQKVCSVMELIQSSLAKSQPV